MAGHDTRDLPQHGETISATTFQPAATHQQRARWRPGPVAVATGVLLALGAVLLWYLLGVRSVQIVTDPPYATVEVSGGIGIRLGERRLLRPGHYRLRVQAAGHLPADQPLEVTEEPDQVVEVQLQREPGRLQLSTTPEGAEVYVNDVLLGRANAQPIELAAGPQQLRLVAPRHIDQVVEIDITGMGQLQDLDVELAPAWGTVTVESTPAGAALWLGDHPLGETPGSFEVDQGEYQLLLRQPGYKTWSRPLAIKAGEHLDLDPVVLEPADATLTIRSEPSGANVTVAGVFQGRTPVDVAVEPGRTVAVQLFRSGYQPYVRELRLASGETRTLAAQLQAQLGTVDVEVRPADAELLVDGRSVGKGSQRLQLPAARQRLRARRAGYAEQEIEIVPKPGFPQALNITLVTEEEAYWTNIPTRITSAAGQQLLLVRPGVFTMGASRREAGRRANEALRQVTLERAYYLGSHEVTNAEFRLFRPAHSSGNLGGKSLNGAKQPVVNLSWDDAALYCNWLSQRDDLPAFYRLTEGKVSGFDRESTGYRLPSEAEWAFAARVTSAGESSKFPWGETWPPGDRAGNFADVSAANLFGQIIAGYQDGELVSAPVGEFKENWRGFFDLGGNVSEWVNDFYVSGIGLEQAETDPLGPGQGEFHTIRDSSYRHGSVVELRLSYRDYGSEPRPDLGFRVARYVR